MKSSLIYFSLIIIAVFLSFSFIVTAATIDSSKIDKIRDREYIDSIRSEDTIRQADDGILIWKDYKSYYSEERRVVIEDSNYEVQLDFNLLTQYDEVVGLGNDTKIASLFLDDWKGGRSEFVDNIELYNIDNDYEVEEKEVWFKYRNLTLHEHCYDINESNFTKGENVTQECFEYNNTEWILFDSLDDLPNKDIEVGIFTETKLYDHYEWVITVEGFEILEFASFLVTDIAYYFKFDEASGDATEASGNVTGNGTVVGATQNVEGIINTAYSFDGNDEVTWGDEGALDITGLISINAWGTVDADLATNEAPRILQKGDNAGNYGFFINYINLDFVADGGIVTSDSVTDMRGTGFRMFTATFNDSANQIIFYLDGSVVSTETYTEPLVGDGNTLHVGDWGGSGSRPWKGKLDEIGVWNRILNSTEISGLYAGGSPGAEQQYPFEPADTCTYSSGNWEVDCSDNCSITSNVDVGGNNISIIGTGTFVTTANITGYSKLHIEGTDASNICRVTCSGGGCFKD